MNRRDLLRGSAGLAVAGGLSAEQSFLGALVDGLNGIAAKETTAKHALTSNSFGDWLKGARGEYRWDYKHFIVMQEALDRITSGQLLRVVFQVPIRHGKSEHNTISYAAYRLERDPKLRILLVSYNLQQASRFSRAIKKLVKKRGVAMSTERDTAADWETAEGGGVRAVGCPSNIASANADLIIIDDPIGSRADAESPAVRDAVWDSLTNDILARAEPHTAVTFTMSRWHQDDPIGRLLHMMPDDWHVIDLPGEAEPNDPLGREEEEALWPEMRNKKWLERKKLELGSYGFASLIQGRPRPREGGMFKYEWWQEMKDYPIVGRMVRYWDLAGTEQVTRKHDPDYTAGALACRMINGQTAFCGLSRFRYSVSRRDDAIVEQAKEDLRRFPGRVVYWIETEAGIQGKERTANIMMRLQNVGMAVWCEHPSGSKKSRAEPLASAAEARNVFLVQGEWNNIFKLEATEFVGDGSNHDDVVDAASGAFAKLNVALAEVSFETVGI